MRRKATNKHIHLLAIKQYLLHGTYASNATPIDKRAVRKRAESFKIVDESDLYYVVKPKRLDDEPPDPDPGSNRANLRKVIFTPKQQMAMVSQMHVSHGGRPLLSGHFLTCHSCFFYEQLNAEAHLRMCMKYKYTIFSFYTMIMYV